LWLLSFVLLGVYAAAGCGPAPPSVSDPEDVMSSLTFSTTATYKWVITEWSKKRGSGSLFSETFSVGGHSW